MLKLTFKEGYSKNEAKLVISQIDHEMSVQLKNVDNKLKQKKHGRFYILARIQELENWKNHYKENTI